MLPQALDVAKTATRKAGDVIMSYYHARYEVQSKGIDNPVTTADLEANRVLRDTLLQAFPQSGWLSEESADDATRHQREWTWVVDPLDGTKEFIQGIDEFVVSVALVQVDEVRLGVTYNPVRREMVYAQSGHGTFCNDRRVHVSTTDRLQGAVTLASRSETSRGEWSRFEAVLSVQPTGSVAYKLALLAQGKCDTTFSLVPKNEWDICAGTILVTEAGGRVSDPQAQPMRFNQPDPLRQGIVATNGALHAPLFDLIAGRV